MADYTDGLSGFIVAVKAEAARYGFVNFPLTDDELEVAYNDGLGVGEMYGVVCDVSAGLTFEKAYASVFGWTPENAVSVSADVGSVSIDVTPTWTSILPVFRAILEDGTVASQQAAWGEIERMARLADLFVASQRPDTAALEEEV